MSYKSFFFLLAAVLIGSCSTAEQTSREISLLDEGWKFTREDAAEFSAKDYKASAWETVSVPHDWAIAGPFDMDIDVQKVKVIEDGQTNARLRTGRTGALPFIGTGWYRYDLGKLPVKDGKIYRLEFDGAMSNAQVYVNGRLAAARPYGYSSFAVDITDCLADGRHNIVAVRLENKEQSSRWYPGAGLYRNVRLVKLNPVHVAHWGTCITTPVIEGSRATVKVATEVENMAGSDKAELQTLILDPDGRQLTVADAKLSVDAKQTVAQEFNLEEIQRWDIESPLLYTAVSRLLIDGRQVDEYTTTFGIREFAFDNEKGFSLNGRRVPLNGVCMHHDLGPLGAAVNTRAIERQLEIMKEMGCNAIRTSHNPAAPELLDLCDRMGLLVMEESFDEWRVGKNKNGYSKYFDEWAERDLTDMIRRDRNRPSIIMWSTGNEIREQKTQKGLETALFLYDICKREDPTRPVTIGMNNHTDAMKHGFWQAVDVLGFNYKPHAYGAMHELQPEYCVYGSETASTVSSRGRYHFPAKETKTAIHEDFHSSSYDLEYPNWASTPDTEFAGQDDNPFVAGEFVWTGFDYLGEPTPYNETVSSRSSYFGIVDLVGMKKDRFYLYQSRWSATPVLHILPHWNWNEGDIVPVHCYTNYPEVELFLNGRSLGKRMKQESGVERYRLIWEDLQYEAGELKAVAYSDKGEAVAEKIVRTAGEPYALVLAPDRTEIKADGKDLSYIEISVVDKDGTLCPNADLQLNVSVKGAELVALCNGDPTSLESFNSGSMKAFSGKCMAIVGKASRKAKVEISVSTPENMAAKTNIIVK